MDMDVDVPVTASDDGDANMGDSVIDSGPGYMAVRRGVERSSRVGNDYQAEVKDWTGPTPDKPEDAKQRPQVDGRPVWLAGKLDPATVNTYLRNVYSLFVQGDDHFRNLYSEERALYFLHSMQYDTAAAAKLLYPIPPDAESKKDDEEAENEGNDGDDFCLKCGDGGNLILCDYPGCQKAYHAACVDLSVVPENDYICPRHACAIGGEPITDKDYVCDHCTTAYCAKHVPPQLRDRVERAADSELINNEPVEFLCTLCLKKAIDRWGAGSQRTLNEKHFMERLKVVLRSVGAPDQIPVVDNKELKLFDMYMAVAAAGGIAKVIEHNRWDEIRKAIRVPGYTNSVSLREHYLTFLYPYETRYFEGSKPLPESFRRAGRGGAAGGAK